MPKSEKCLIAQEVEKILPEAVTISSNFITNIFTLASGIEKQDENILIRTPVEHGLEAEDMVKLISHTGQSEIKVLEVNSASSFLVKLDYMPERIFVFGKKVDDFRAIDYDYIFSTGIGAIQELSKKKPQSGKEKQRT